MILDFDRVAVMDQGRVVEYDSPSVLLARQSMFRALHDSARRGQYRAEDLEISAVGT